MRDRVEVINRFQITGDFFFARLFLFLFLSLYYLFHFHFRFHRAIKPIHSGRVRTKIEPQCEVIAKEPRNLDRMIVVESPATVAATDFR